MKASWSWLFGVVGSAAMALGANAATHHVPEDYATIQGAIDVAASGDSVLVGPGTWTSETRSLWVCGNFLTRRSVMFLKPGLTIIGTAGPDVTILDGGEGTTPPIDTVLMTNVDGAPLRLEGFTITGDGDGVVFGCTDAGLELVRCRLVGNGNVGLAAGDASRVSLVDCVVSDNQWHEGSSQDGAVLIVGGEFEAINTRFESNPFGGLSAGGVSPLSVDGCEFVDHPSRSLVLGNCAAVTIRNSLFLRSRANLGWGGAVVLNGSNTATIEFCTFAYDSALAGNVGALSVLNSSDVIIRHNTFYRCYTPFRGGALGISLSTATVSGNIAVECEGRAFAAFSGSTIRMPESGCNVLWNAENYHQWPAEAMQTDVIADPEFCDPAALDFTIRDSSAAAAANSGACGQIGAHGVGCGSISVEATTWGRIKSQFRGN